MNTGDTPVESKNGLLTTVAVGLNGKATYAPVSYTHLDVYKRQVLYGKALRAVLPACSARPVRTFQRPDLPVPTEHKAGGSTQQSQ